MKHTTWNESFQRYHSIVLSLACRYRKIIMNIFIEAAGLVAIAYATFAVVSFLEIKNKYEDGFVAPGEGARTSTDEDDFASFVEPERPIPKKKGKNPKRGKRSSRPRACLGRSVASSTYQKGVRLSFF
jgi:hypothetical protein